MSLELRPLSDALGAEVLGIDMSSQLADTVIADIRAAWLKYNILLFREVDWTPAQHVTFTRRFGDLHIMPSLANEEPTNHPDHPEIMVVSNVKRNGLPIGLRRAGWGWHSDGEDKQLPNMGSMLHALQVPTGCGDTAFANTYKAYETLDPGIRLRIEGKLGRFSRIERHNHNYPDLPPLTEEEKAGRPDVWHPVTRTHPETGRTALFIGRWAVEIEGIPKAEGEGLIEKLKTHAVKPEFTYTHSWQAGDVILWDNRCTQHCALPFDDETYDRHMQRTTLEGDTPYYETLGGEKILSYVT